jgi:hypothetical protein
VAGPESVVAVESSEIMLWTSPHSRISQANSLKPEVRRNIRGERQTGVASKVQK